MNLFLTCGLANRIRTLLGYLWLAEKTGEELGVFWQIGDDCNGHFLDLFRPLERVTFIESSNETKIDFKGQLGFHAILESHLRSYGLDSSIDQEQKRMYRKLEPLPRIREKADLFCEKNRIPSCIGLHIRRADHEGLAKSVRLFSADDDFINFIRNKPECEGVFIATDNKETQDRFRALYGRRAIFYTNLVSSRQLRQSTLEEALIDILICARCRCFKGSGYSSYSDLIEIFRSLNSNCGSNLPVSSRGRSMRKPDADAPIGAQRVWL
jgi:hypothetical protein